MNRAPSWFARLRLIPTQRGAMLALAAALLFLAALNTGSNLFYLVFAGLGAVLVLSFFAPLGNLRRVALLREPPHGVHRGEPFSIGLTLKNRSASWPVLSVRVAEATRREETLAYLAALGPREEARLSVMETLPRRGVHRLPPLVVESGYPFGLLTRRRLMQDNAEVVVYPRVRPLRTASLEQSTRTGARSRTALRDGDEFFSLREYVPGDDPRLISWRASARVGKPLVRELERSVARRLVFVLDARQCPRLEDFDERFEDTVEVLASLAVTLLNRQYAVAMSVGDRDVPEGEGRSHAARILDLLARVEPVAEDAPDPFARAAAALPRGAALVCLSPDPGLWGRVVGPGLRVLDPREVVYA